MVNEVELGSIDVCYQQYRMRSAMAEGALLLSIVKHGIRDPVYGIEESAGLVLLDGFKRYRCARKLGIGMMQYEQLSKDKAEGILEFIRQSTIRKGLSILEQAVLIDELQRQYGMSITQIAGYIEKSKAWVSVRSGVLKEISERVLEKIFSGEFSAYAYLYTIRPFMRVNKLSRHDVEEFVDCVSGKHLSVREIEMLARGYFQGGEEIRTQIRQGSVGWSIESMCQQHREEGGGCSEVERSMLRALEIVQRNHRRVIQQSTDKRLRSGSFCAQASLLSGSIIAELPQFGRSIQGLYDRSSEKTGDIQPS